MQLWGKKEAWPNSIKFYDDKEINLKVLEISVEKRSKICDTYIAIPGLSYKHILALTLPVLILLMKEVYNSFFFYIEIKK